MPIMTEVITQALAPGVALTSVIFYNTSLQNRFLYVTGRARDLCKEARGLQAEAGQGAGGRMTSIRWQVDMLARRTEVIRRTILMAYGGLFCFVVTILQLLMQGLFPLPWLVGLPILTFGLGFVALGVATLYSTAEMALSARTIHEDIRSSFPAVTAVQE